MERELGTDAPFGRAAWASEWMFLVISAILFTAAVGSTIAWSSSMPGGMQMPGGWTLPMAWAKMPEQTWQPAFCYYNVVVQKDQILTRSHCRADVIAAGEAFVD